MFSESLIPLQEKLHGNVWNALRCFDQKGISNLTWPYTLLKNCTTVILVEKHFDLKVSVITVVDFHNEAGEIKNNFFREKSVQMRAPKTAAYYISPIEIGVL